MTKAAKIAITIPPDDLAAADALAARLGRSRSWVLSEALRRFVAFEQLSQALDASRQAQLARDLRLSASDRVREGEADVVTLGPSGTAPTSAPRTFATYAEFAAWRRQRARE
ncbi:MAG: ribbon-helix-helix protein, CopG family [Gemmatimonadaceae bacterium]|nr:ribbon-helix-helix protein, CopG family [Gemmatimonadaceae bacterium]